MFFEALEGRALLAVDAVNDAGTTNEDTILTVVNPGSTTSLLANDTGTPAPTVLSFQAVSAQGATVNVNPNGTFSYNPTAAIPLQRLGTGESVVDTFTYTATDGIFNADGLIRVQLLVSTGTVPGNDTNNWLNVYNALDGGAGPTGNVAGFNIVTNVSDTETSFNYPPGTGNFGGDLALESINGNGPGGAGGPFNGGDNYSVRARTFLRFPSAGTFTIGMGSDDGRRIRLTPAYSGSAPGYSGFSSIGDQVNGAFTPGDTVFGFSGGTGHAWSVGTFNVAAGDILALDAFYYEGGGGDSGEIAIASGAQGTFNGSFLLLTNGALGVQLSSVGLNTDTATVSITVNGINTAPVAAADDYATNEDTAITVPALLEVPGMNVAVYQGTDASIGSLDAARGGVPSNTGTVLLADFLGNGGSPRFPGGNAFPGTGGDNYGVVASGILRVNTAGTYTFGLNSDDAARIRIDRNQNGVIATDGSEDVAFLGGCCTDAFGSPIVLAAGDYAFEAMYTEGGGGDYGEFFYSPGSHTTFGGTFKLIGDSSGGIASFASIQRPGLLGNDFDEEDSNGNTDQNLTVTQLNGGALTGFSSMGAKVTLNADGSFTYDPNQVGSKVQALALGQTATDTFTYTVSDSATKSPALTATGTVSIKVTGRNDLPVAKDDTYTTTEDSKLNNTDKDAAPRNKLGDTTPGNANDDGVLVNDTEFDDNDIFEVVSARTVFGPGMDVAVYNQQGSETGYGTFAGADAVRNTVGRLPNQTGTVQQADFFGNGGSPHFGVNNAFPGTGGDNYAVYLNGLLRVNVAGTYTFGTNTDDNSRIRIDLNKNGNPNDDGNVVTQGGCCGDVFGTVTLAVGDYPFEAMYTEGGGGDYGEFFYSPGTHTSFGTGTFALIGDPSQGISSFRYSDTVLSGSLGTLGNGSASFKSSAGASVVLNDDGTFTYDPTTVPAFQKMGAGQTASDSFSYTATDNRFAQGLTIKVYQPTGAGDLAATDAFLAGARPNERFNGVRPTVNFFGTGAQGQFNGAGTASPMDDEIPTPGLGGGDQNDFIVEVTGKVFIPVAGQYTFSVNSDDGFGLTFSNGPGTVDLQAVHGDNDGTSTTGTVNPRLRRSTGRGSVDTFGIFNFSAPGEYDVNLVNWEGAGGANVEFFAAPGAFTSFGATNTWRLVGDTDNGGLATTSTIRNTTSATVNITVNGVNGNPTAVADNYATNEDTVLTVAAVTPVPGMKVAVFQGTNAGIGSIDAARSGVPSNTGTVLLADFIGNGGSPRFPGGNAFPGTGGDNYGVLLTGILRVNTAGTYTFGVNSDDASRIRIDLDKNGTIATDGTEDVAFLGGCCADAFGSAVVLAAGDYAFEAMYTEGGGGDYGEFFYSPGTHTAFGPTFKLIGDSSGGISSIAEFQPTGVVANDLDEEINNGNPAQSFTVTQLNGGALSGTSTLGAKVTLNADGSFNYDPNQLGSKVQALAAGQVANDTFTYTVIDNAGGTPAVGTVTIKVTGRNDLPVAKNDTYTTNEDTKLNNADTDAAPRNQIGDKSPGNPNDDGVLVNDIEIDDNDVYEVLSASTLAPGMNVAVFGGTNAGIASLDAARTGTPTNTGTVLLADFIGNGGGPRFPGGNAFPGTGGDNYGVLITGVLRVGTAGTYTFGVNSDDASRIRIDLNQDGTIATDGSEDVAFLPGCCADNIGAPVVLAAGDYAFEAMYTEGGGGDYGEFFYAPGSHAAFNASFKLIGDSTGGISALAPATHTLSGTVGTLGNGSATFTTLQGATVVLNDDGTFSYDPTMSTTLQKLAAGQTVNDSFTYTATDNRFAPGLTIKVYQPTGAGDLAATDAFLAGPRPNERFNGVRPTVNFFGTGAQGQFNGPGTASPMDDEIPTPGLGGGDQNDFIVEVTGKIVIPAAGSYTFSVNSDDGFGLTFSNGPGTVDLVSVHGDNDGTSTTGTVNPRLRRSTGRGSVDTFGVFNFSAPGEYDLTLVNWEGAGGANVEFFAAPGVFTSFGATNTWRLVGDTDNGGLQTFSYTRNTTTATVNITVNGLNDAPVANDDGPFTTNENTPLVVTAGVVPGILLETYRDGSIGAGMPSADNARATLSPVATAIELVADMFDPEGHFPAGNFPNNIPFPGNTGADDNNYAVFGTGILRVNVAGTYTFGSSTDDNSRLRIDLDQDGVLEGALGALGGSESHPGGGTVVWQPGCCGNVFGNAVTLAAGFYRYELVYTEGGGGSSGEFFYAPGIKTAFDSDFRLIGDGSQGIDSLVSINGLLVNDSDIDNGDTISVDTAPIISTKGATITPLADGSFTYDPSTSHAAQLLKDGETLTDTFTYTLRDSKGATDTATVTVIVNGISDAVNDSYTVNEDISLSVPAATGVLANDALPGNPAFTVVRAESSTVTGPTKITTKKGGEVTISPDGSFSYDQKGVFNSLPLGKNGADSFDYEISSGSGGAPALGTVTTQSSAGAFAVSATDLLSGITPTVTGGGINTSEGTTGNVAVLSNGTFGAAGLPDGAALAETLAINNNTTLTYKLDTVAQPGGYDIAQIKTYSGWRDSGRDDQDYTVEYETVASPGTWVSFTAGAISFVPGTPPSGEVTISSPTGILATGVAQIRFVFGTQENGYVGYRELDVFGVFRSTATVNLTVVGQNDAPTAEANGPYNIGLGQNLNVTAAGSTDPDAGTVLQYGWDLDNNGTVDYTSAPPPGNTTAAITIPWSVLQALPTPLGAGTHTIRLIVSDGITTAFDTATLTISDTFTFNPPADGVADGYLLIRNAAQTMFEVRDTPTNTLITSFPVAGTNSIVFIGNSDNETLTIDFTNTTPIPAASGVTFNAGGGTDGIVYRNGTVGTVAQNYVTDNNGSTTIDARVVTYTGLESLNDTLTAANRNFSFTGGNETVTLQNLVAGTSLQIDSDVGAITSFNRPTDSLTVNLATGSSDTLNIASATLTGNFTVNGSDGNDNVNVNGAVVVTAGATLPGLVSVSGNNIAFVAGSITTPNNVNLTAAGNISSTTTAVDVSAAALAAASATGVDLDTSVTTLSATASTAGSTVVIDEANAVTLLNVTTNNGAITINTLAAGDVTAENVNSGTAATSITVNNGNLVSGAADPGVADIVAGNLTLLLSTGARNYGVSAANRLEINATQLRANTAGGMNNSAFIVDTAGGLQMNDSSLGATGVTVFDLVVQNGSLTSVVGGPGDIRAIQVIVAVTGATSTIGASAAAPLEINAATLDPAARFDAITAGAATSHVWVTDVADNFPIGTINAGLADVFLTSSFATGSIIDNAADSTNDIVAARLVLTATGGGIGNGANGNLETMLGALEATAGTGGVNLANTGDLVIGGISAAVGVSATGGGVTISSVGSITANENVTATGAGSNVSLVTIDASTAGQDLNIGANVTVSSASGSVTLNAGDNFSMGANSTINSPSSPLVINIDSGNADTIGGTLTIPNTAMLNTPSATFNGANPGTATDIDTFTFAPLATVPIVVNGFNPTSGSGDVLNLDLAGATGTTLTIDGLNDGTYTFTNRASVEYNSIEVVNAIAGAYDLVLNMAGFGVPGDFTIRRNSPFVGANLEIVNNTNGTIPFAGNISFIASLTVLGTTGNDRLVIDDVNGMVSFDPLLTPTAVFPDNPNGAGTPRLFFNADTGVDTLIFQLTEAGAQQTYHIGSGSGPGAGDGEVATTNTAGRNLVTYFTGLGNDGSSVVRSGSGAGAFTVAGDTNGNTINVQANGTATRVDPVGYTPFDFAGNNFATLGVDGGLGADTLNLVSIGSGQTSPLATVFNGGADSDILRVQSTSGNTGTVTLIGGSGNDLFQLFSSTNTVDGIAGQVIVDGTDGNVGGNTDTLVIVDTGDTTGDTVLLAAVNAASSADYKLDGITGAGAGIDDVIIRNIDVLDYTGTSGDDIIDAQLVNTVPPHDLTSITLNGWVGADQFLLFTSDQVGGSGPNNTPTGTPSGVASISLNGDAPGNPNGVDGNDVFGATPPGLTGTGAGNVGLTVADTVRMIRPSLTTGIDINGGQPTGTVPPISDTIGDTFNLNLSGLPANSSLILPTASGVVAASGLAPITYAQIEDINLILNQQLINVQMGDTLVRGTDNPDTILFSRNALLGTNGTRIRVNADFVDVVLSGKTLTFAGAGNDTVNQANVTRPAEIYGEAGNDYISGGTNNDFLVGGLGNDQINAGGGDNVVWGDDSPSTAVPNPQDLAVGGDDVLSALGGNDVFYGGGGNDQVSAGGGNDYANGGQGNDILGGGDGDDRLYGGDGDDVLGGGAGHDLLSGGNSGNGGPTGEFMDRLIGNSGNDILIGGFGVDDLNGGEGDDLLITGSVANESSSRTSVATTANYGAATYSDPADNDAALLNLLMLWSSVGDRTLLAAITHDGVDDDVYGYTGNDHFVWEAADLLDEGGKLVPPDFNAANMGADVRFGPM